MPVHPDDLMTVDFEVLGQGGKRDEVTVAGVMNMLLLDQGLAESSIARLVELGALVQKDGDVFGLTEDGIAVREQHNAARG